MLFNRRNSLCARFVLTIAWMAGLFGVIPVSPVYAAATLIVPDNYPKIQAAINAANPGDTIVVRSGTYSERLTLSKSVILTAASYTSLNPTRNTTIIDGGSSNSVATITIPPGVSPMPTVRGFIIRNGVDNITVASEAIIEYNYFIGSTDQLDFRAGGGGIVRRNVFFDSQDDAIDLDNMNRPLLIEHNRMMYNRDDGIEVRLQDATAPAQPITISILKNEIIGCDEDGIQFIDYGQAVNTNRNYIVTGNLIANCRFAGIGLMGNAISVEDYSGANIIENIRVYNNTIYGNDYGISGGDNLIAINNIIANSTTRGVWRVQGPTGASSAVTYTLFYNNGIDAEQSTLGAGNKFGQNPRFAYPPNAGPDGVWKTVDDDFRGLVLLSGSPAIDAGQDTICPSTDLLGVHRPLGAHCDIGAFEFKHDSTSANVQVLVAGASQGTYSIAPHYSIKSSYAGINNGPVRVVSTNGIPIVASERVAYSPNGGTTWTSYSELMGLPYNQLTTSYTFPWYNNVDLNSQLRFGNVGTANTTVTVTIGGIVRGNYPLAPNQSTRISYPGLDGGPVKVTSSGNVPIIASMRVAYFNGSKWTSFSELMGLPSNKLTNSYIFPWYNNLDLNSQLRFGNVGTSPTTVTVTIGGVFQGNYNLIPNESKRVSYTGLDGGPVKVTSSGNVPIIASMRVAYFNGSAWTDFSELMGLPISSLSTRYSFPIYNNVNLNSQLRFGNVGNITTTVRVTINGILKGTYNLAPNASQRVSYAGLDSGPVVIQSSGNVPIIASERVAYFNGSVWTSFAEMMGLPQSQWTTIYLFPWYNNVDINSQLRFGVP